MPSSRCSCANQPPSSDAQDRGQRRGRCLDDGHVRAEPVCAGGDFLADEAGADHDHARAGAKRLSQPAGVGEASQLVDVGEALRARQPAWAAAGGDQQLRERQARAGGERQLACGDVQAGCPLAEQQLDVAVAVPLVGAEAQRGFIDPSREVLLGKRRAVVGRDGLIADEPNRTVMAVAAKCLDRTLGGESPAGDHDAGTASAVLVIGHDASIGGPVEPPVSAQSEGSYPPVEVRALYPGPNPQLEHADQARGHPNTPSLKGAQMHSNRAPSRRIIVLADRDVTALDAHQLEALNNAVADAHVHGRRTRPPGRGRAVDRRSDRPPCARRRAPRPTGRRCSSGKCASSSSRSVTRARAARCLTPAAPSGPTM